jgi:hypothetical protein
LFQMLYLTVTRGDRPLHRFLSFHAGLFQLLLQFCNGCFELRAIHDTKPGTS